MENLQLLNEQPDFSQRAMLIIEALTPLSLVVKMPGKYYRSQPEPSDIMLLAMLENALGWHFSEPDRFAIIAALVNTDFAWPEQKQAQGRLKERLRQRWAEKQGLPIVQSGVEFVSLLQFHIRIESRLIPDLIHFDDLWSQHLRGGRFPTGSRNHDARLIPLMNLASKKIRPKSGTGKLVSAVTFSDKASADKSPDKIDNFQEYDEIHLDVIRPYFPQYYISPTPREYVLPQGEYKYVLQTSPALAKALSQAFDDPAAPLYLGSNDGWVDASWELLP